jgi:PEP-CTERM motif
LRRLASLIFLLSAGAWASPLTWTLQGVTFTDGGTASGSFVFDATSGIFSSINITTTTGSVLTGANYTFPDPGNVAHNGPAELFMVTSNAADLTGTPILTLIWASNLTNAGGIVPFSSTLNSGETTCTSPTCSSIDQTTGRTTTAGAISAPASVPEPATILLVGSALAVLGWWRTHSCGPCSHSCEHKL